MIVKDAFYWVWLLYALMSLRLEESTQAHVVDVVRLYGVWCLKVRPGLNKHVKRSASIRTLPIHHVLIKLGFVEYVQALRAAGQVRLFPELKPDARHRYGGYLSKAFTRYCRHVALYDRRRPGHSFRHSFDTYLERAGVTESRRACLMGHVRAGETGGRYLKSANLQALQLEVDKLDYGLQLVCQDGQWQIDRIATLAVPLDADDEEYGAAQEREHAPNPGPGLDLLQAVG